MEITERSGEDLALGQVGEFSFRLLDFCGVVETCVFESLGRQ